MPDVNILINAVDRASAPLKAVGGAVDNLAGKATGAARGGLSVLSNALGTALKVGAATGVVALGGLAAAVVTTGVNFDNMKQQANIAFTTMLGDGEKAKLFLDDLQRFAAATPFEFPELLQASQRLLAMGFAAEDVKPTLTAIGDAVAGLGGSSETVGRVATALGQIQAKGKASAEEMMQLTEAGIPAWKMLADAIGVSVPEAMKLVEKGAVSAETTIDAVVAGMNANFGGMMEKQSQTFGGLLSTIKDTFTQVSGTVMQPIFEQLTKGLAAVVEWTSKPEFSAGVQRFAEWLGNATEKLVAWTISIWPGVYSAITGVYEIFRLLVTGDFRGGIFGLQEDDPIVLALLGIHNAFVLVRDFVVNELPDWKEKWKGWALAIGGWIVDAAGLLATQLNVWWTELSGWLVANLPAFVSNLGAWAKAAWQWIVDAAGVVGTRLSDWYIAISTWLTQNIPIFITQIGEWAVAAWQWIVNAASQLPAKLTEWYGVLETWVNENLPTWQAKMEEWGQAALNGLKPIGDYLATTFPASAAASTFSLEILTRAFEAFDEATRFDGAEGGMNLAELTTDILGILDALVGVQMINASTKLSELLMLFAALRKAIEGDWVGMSNMFDRIDAMKRQAEIEKLKIIGGALENLQPDTTPQFSPGTLQPQSFRPGLTPFVPAMAGVSSAGTINHNETFYIEQYIGANGDVGGARAGAEAGMDRIRDDLINRRLNG